ncbi:MAG: hypothetical protein U9P73_01125 [Candidatus Cloacimonadota bacterium]|nr:hypothetical protein [Candidatus Cloacimonadota bacterium]
MKRILPFLVFILIFGCKESEETLRNNRRREYREARKFAIQDTVIIKDIFLSFEFGDTENEFDNKKEALIKEGKIDKENQWNYIYRKTPKGIKKATFFMIPEFLNDKLFQLRIISQVGDEIDTYSIWHNMFGELAFKNLFHDKNRNFDDFEFNKYDFQISFNLKNRFPLFKILYHNLELYIYTNVYNQIIVEYTNINVKPQLKITDNELMLKRYLP